MQTAEIVNPSCSSEKHDSSPRDHNGDCYIHPFPLRPGRQRCLQDQLYTAAGQWTQRQLPRQPGVPARPEDRRTVEVGP